MKDDTGFISICHTKVVVAKSVKKELHRLNAQMRRRMRAEGRCAQADFLRCSGDCDSCRWCRSGIFESLEQWTESDSNTVLVSPEDVESTVLNSVMWSEIDRLADSVAEHGALMLHLSVIDGISNRKIAERLGVNSRSVDRHLKKILQTLQAQKEKIF